MKRYFVALFGLLIGYVGSYAAIVRPNPGPFFICGFALGTESFTMPLNPDYRCRSLNPVLTQFYKPLHWADVKLRPRYWSFEFNPPEPIVEVEAF